MKTNFTLPLLILALVGWSGFARAQGTAFSYQGKLDDGGLPATGLYDFTFNVFAVDVAGVALAGPLPLGAVPVTNGLFNVILDFGPGIFTGPARWLEIAVRTNGVGAPALLAPRTPLLPTPYSYFAGKAAGVVNGSVTANQLNVAGAPPTAGQFLSYDGGNFHWSDPGVAVGNVWSLNGSSAYYNAGNVGVGTISPATRLTVLTAPNNYGIEHTDGNVRMGTFLGGSAGGGWIGTRSNHRLSFYVNDGSSSMVVDTNGYVGIGTISPKHRLSIGGSLPAWTANGWGGAAELVNGAAIGWQSNALGQRFGMGHTSAGFFLFRTASDPGTAGSPALYDFVVDNSGNVGIGTTTPTAGYRLEVAGATVLRPANGTVEFGSPNGESGMTIKPTAGNRADLRFDGVTLKLLATTGVAPPSSVNGITINATSGNVGIGGSLYPVAKLEVVGQDALRLVGYQPFLTLLDDNAGYARGRIQSYAGNIALEPESFLNGSDPNSSVVLANSGNVSVKTLTIRGGADVAEPFELTEKEIAKGSVVVIDEEQPGKLKLSTRAYDTQVAGIVSGANGIDPGISLYQQGALEGGRNVALSGRVYVKADASTGAIKPGDLLTTSATPGHAMKVSDHARSQGAILGKAMSGLKEGKGMVLVLVTLQ